MVTATACACIGPIGDCPCIRNARGLLVPILETYISPEVFNCLTDEEKSTINSLKHTAFFRHMEKVNNEASKKIVELGDKDRLTSGLPGIDRSRSEPNSFRF